VLAGQSGNRVVQRSLADELTRVVQRTGVIIRRQIGPKGDGRLVSERSTGSVYRAQWNNKWQAYDLFRGDLYVMQVKPDDPDYAIVGDDDDMEETPAHVDGATAVADILTFLTRNMDKDNNYCVALLGNDDLVIAKVNGVTDEAAGMAELGAHIQRNNLNAGRSVFLAQKYNTAVGSNHAEMCIVAAANAMGQNVTQMGCTGPNCPYCAAVLQHEGIDSLNAGQDGKSQQGWAHPTQSYFWGSQVSDLKVHVQVADLKAFLNGAAPKIGSKTLKPSKGMFLGWL
jgi:hypothetical protein